MRPDSIKQKIKQLVQEILLGHFGVSAEAEVERYSYATKLGSLPHIDYAIPLFGYARLAEQDASSIYTHLEKRLCAELPCKAEFVNGYMNIMIDNDYLKDALQAHQEFAANPSPPQGQKIALICSADDPNTAVAAKLIQECLIHCHIDNQAPLYPIPFPAKGSQPVRPADKSDQKMRVMLAKLPGVVDETDSKALYLQVGEEAHALCSARGRWYPIAFIIAAVKQQLDLQNRVLMLGRSEHNQIIRSIFPEIGVLDVDVSAKHLKETYQKSVQDVVSNSKSNFGTRSISALDTKQRRELIQILDFDHEVIEALELGDLKRLMGEITTLMSQHPLPDIA